MQIDKHIQEDIKGEHSAMLIHTGHVPHYVAHRIVIRRHVQWHIHLHVVFRKCLPHLYAYHLHIQPVTEVQIQPLLYHHLLYIHLLSITQNLLKTMRCVTKKPNNGE